MTDYVSVDVKSVCIGIQDNHLIFLLILKRNSTEYLYERYINQTFRTYR